MAADYKLIPEAVPSKARNSVYTRIIEDFAAGADASVRVAIDRKPATLVLGLGKARQSDPRFKGISVQRRGDAVYLKK